MEYVPRRRGIAVAVVLGAVFIAALVLMTLAMRGRLTGSLLEPGAEKEQASEQQEPDIKPGEVIVRITSPAQALGVGAIDVNDPAATVRAAADTAHGSLAPFLKQSAHIR